MRTTVSIADELVAAAKERAAKTGKSLGQVIEAALRRDLADAGMDEDPPRVPVFTGGTGPRPDVDLTSNRDLYRVLDDVDLNKMA